LESICVMEDGYKLWEWFYEGSQSCLVGLGTNNRRAGESQQKFSSQYITNYENVENLERDDRNLIQNAIPCIQLLEALEQTSQGRR
jgi:hypothetical protein